jgi:acyl-CoA reductase-like NAD-dependent aldehyde dehydrogenase
MLCFPPPIISRSFSVTLGLSVLAAFTPWNFRINQVARKLSCALAVGCSIIVKAPEETPHRRRNRSAASWMPACRRAW